MAYSPRQVILCWDRGTHPPKRKLLICVSEQRQLFLRINSRPIFRPHHLLTARHNAFLDHDSYVELQQLVRLFAYDIAESEQIGTLSPRQAGLLCDSVRLAETLTEDQKDLICRQLLDGA